MTAIPRRGRSRLPFVLLGMALVGLAMARSASRPTPIPLVIEASSFALGTTPSGAFRRHSWVIRNAGRVPLRLRTRFTSGRCGFSLWLGEDYVVPAGESLTVSLTIPTPALGSIPFAALADVATDDPDTPKLRFRAYGITAP